MSLETIGKAIVSGQIEHDASTQTIRCPYMWGYLGILIASELPAIPICMVTSNQNANKKNKHAVIYIEFTCAWPGWDNVALCYYFQFLHPGK